MWAIYLNSNNKGNGYSTHVSLLKSKSDISSINEAIKLFLFINFGFD